MGKKELDMKTRNALGGSFVSLTDGYTHYELSGKRDAKTVVLIHGNAAPICSWDYTVGALVNAGYRVLRYDVFGHGYSDRPKYETYDRDLYDRQLSELLEKLNIKTPVYLVGTSQGGSIAAYFVAHHAGCVEKMALLAPLYDEFDGQKNVAFIKSKLGSMLMKLAGDKAFANPSRVLYSDEKKQELADKLMKQLAFEGKRRAVLANLRGNSVEDASEYYQEIRKQQIPLFLTWGDHDNSIPKLSMDRLINLLPDTEFHLIQGASHLAHYEFPEKVNPQLIRFFNDSIRAHR